MLTNWQYPFHQDENQFWRQQYFACFYIYLVVYLRTPAFPKTEFHTLLMNFIYKNAMTNS